MLGKPSIGDYFKQEAIGFCSGILGDMDGYGAR